MTISEYASSGRRGGCGGGGGGGGGMWRAGTVNTRTHDRVAAADRVRWFVEMEWKNIYHFGGYLDVVRARTGKTERSTLVRRTSTDRTSLPTSVPFCAQALVYRPLFFNKRPYLRLKEKEGLRVQTPRRFSYNIHRWFSNKKINNRNLDFVLQILPIAYTYIWSKNRARGGARYLGSTLTGKMDEWERERYKDQNKCYNGMTSRSLNVRQYQYRLVRPVIMYRL